MMSGTHRLDRPRYELSKSTFRQLRTQQIIVSPHRVGWKECCQVFPEGSCAARRRLQMVNRSVWAKQDGMPGRCPPVCELTLEVVGDTNKILIKAADRDRMISWQ